ncbi:MAG: hypothetical protein GF331_12370 [Chitinivibrionales bacterium]|nr:hypothetical protein [Chitinivibrionales bacterium]
MIELQQVSHLLRIALTAAVIGGACHIPIGAATPSAPPPPDSISVTYSEKALDLTWNAVTGADGYHVYTAPEPGLPKAKRRKINNALITSGTHFTYIWDVNGKERTRAIKGKRHYLAVTAVALDGSTEVEGPLSHEIDNDYFHGYERVIRKAQLERILQDRQQTEHLPVDQKRNKKTAFIAFMTGPCAYLQKLARDTIDFQQMGACAPLTTVLVQLMLDWGLHGWKVEGTFIKEFHSFAVVPVDKVEYVVDVTADQFIPGVGPVVLPRDYCFLNANGRFDTHGTPVYRIGKVFDPASSVLIEGEAGDLFRYLLAAVRAKYPAPR